LISNRRSGSCEQLGHTLQGDSSAGEAAQPTRRARVR
jgi:hypothetical protein